MPVKKFKFLIIFVSVFIISTLILCAPSTYAMSAPDTFHDGFVSGDFAFVGGEGLVAESLDVSYSFSQNLKVFDENNASSYKGRVESEYVLFNGSDKDVSVSFYVRDADVPPYFYGAPSEFAQVYLNGKELKGKMRFTLEYFNDSEKNNYISAINDDASGVGGILPDTDVYVQRFRVTVTDPDIISCEAVMLGYDGSLPILSYNLFLTKTEDDREVVYFATSDYGVFEVVSIGAPLGEEVYWAIADEATDVLSSEYIDGNVELVATEKTDYYSFIVENTDASGQLLTDCADCFSAIVAEEEGFKAYNLKWFFSKDAIIQWEETEITVPAGERVTLKVSEPFFPSISEQNRYCKYIAEYAIADFVRAEDFSFQLEIKTPYLAEVNTALIKNDIGYCYEEVGFSEDTFGFTLTSELSGGSYDDDGSDCGGGGWIVLLILLLPLLLLGVVIAIVLFLICAAVVFVCIGAAVAAVVLIVYGIVRLIMFIVKKARK